MARVKFEVQELEVFQTTIGARVDDVNYGGHLGNDSVLTLCHEARIRFLNEIGQSKSELYGKGIIMTDAIVIYEGEGSLGDQIEVTICIDDIGK